MVSGSSTLSWQTIQKKKCKKHYREMVRKREIGSVEPHTMEDTCCIIAGIKELMELAKHRFGLCRAIFISKKGRHVAVFTALKSTLDHE